jgi:hypothetical protein
VPVAFDNHRDLVNSAAVDVVAVTVKVPRQSVTMARVRPELADMTSLFGWLAAVPARRCRRGGGGRHRRWRLVGRRRGGLPSGASRESVELRDGDPARCAGKGVLRAVANVTTRSTTLRGRRFTGPAELDPLLNAAQVLTGAVVTVKFQRQPIETFQCLATAPPWPIPEVSMSVFSRIRAPAMP